MSKELIFDMDGTIADLYNVKDWLPKVRNEDASPYREAMPLYDMDSLAAIVGLLRDLGFKIKIVSWTSKDGSSDYNREVRKAKLEWLSKYNFPYDECHIVKYGTPKQKFIKDEYSILIDDNEEVIANFLKSTRGNEKKAINAKRNIVKSLVDLIVEECTTAKQKEGGIAC